MSAHDWQVANYGGRSIESDYIDQPTDIRGCFQAMALAREAEKADQPLDEARKARAAEKLARNEAFAKARRSAPVEDKLRAERLAKGGNTAIAQAMAKASRRAGKK